jgi:nicotinamide mononucleotide (NMN) deamidase PncC
VKVKKVTESVVGGDSGPGCDDSNSTRTVGAALKKKKDGACSVKEATTGGSLTRDLEQIQGKLSIVRWMNKGCLGGTA